MTRIAIKLGVCSVDAEFGLVVIEIPDFPIARTVATFAFLAESPLMNIILLMAS